MDLILTHLAKINVKYEAEMIWDVSSVEKLVIPRNVFAVHC